MSLLNDLRIVDLTGLEGAYAGKLLGDLGADVLRPVPPEGDALASVPPFGPSGRSLAYEHFLTGRRAAAFDPGTADGRRAFDAALGGADVLIESLPDIERRGWGLDESLHGRHPRLVHVALSGFGRTGPRAATPWSELTAAAAGGLLYLIGEPDRPPVMLGGNQLYHLAGTYAAAAALIGAQRAATTGRGACVDLSMQEIAFSITGDRQPLIMQSLVGAPPRRTGNQTPHFYPYRNFPCRNGWVTICALEPKQWAAFAAWVAEVTGDESILDPRFAGRGYDRVIHVAELEPKIRAFCAQLDKADLYFEGQARGIPIMPANSVADLLDDPQLLARAYFATLEVDGRSAVRTTGRPYRLDLDGVPVAPAPRGMTSGTVWTARAPRSEESSSGDRRLPLAGLRVLEVGWYVASPWIGLQLARQGAEVIKVETSKSVDIMRRVPIINDIPTGADYASFGGGKRSVTLDMRTDRGRELLAQLIARSDVVTENFSLEAGRRFGLDWDTVSRANPRAILLRMPGFGLTGPTSEYVSYGMAMAALAGLDLITGFEDGPPGGNSISYPDYVAGQHGLIAILAALRARERTGRGQQIELSQFESSVSVLGPAFLDYGLNGVIASRHGNAHPVSSPQGVYPARGDDRWVALTVPDDARWGALAALIGEGLDRREWQTVEGRRSSTGEIDERIARWTRERSAEEVTGALLSIDIPASVVATSADILADRHLAARGFIVSLEVPGYGELPFARSPIALDGQTGGPALPHALGADNDYVFRDLLGVPEADYASLIADGVIE